MAQNQSNRESKAEIKERETFIARWECHKLNQRFPNEDSCVKELNRRFKGDREIVCSKCDSNKTSKIDERSFLCLACHKRGWFTAGTPFANLKKVKPWLFAKLLSEKRIKLNGSQLADLTMISKSNGANIIRRVATFTDTISDESDTAELTTVSYPDNLIQISEYKPTKKPSRVERRKAQQVKQLEQSDDLSIDSVRPSLKVEQLKMQSEKESRLYALLTETPQDFDTLRDELDFDINTMSSTLTLLELDGRATRLAGDRYIRTEKPEEKPRVKRNRSKKAIKAVSPNIIQSIVVPIKLAFKNISKTICDKAQKICDKAQKLADVLKRKFDETLTRSTKPLLR